MKHEEIKAALFETATVEETISLLNFKKILDEIDYISPIIPVYGEPCSNELSKQYQLIKHPAIYMAEVVDYKLIGGCAFPIVNNKCVKPQNFDPAIWETSEQARGRCMIKDNLVAYVKLKGLFDHDIKVINLTGNGSSNYAHWMTEFLPQIVLIKESGINLDDYHIVISDQSPDSIIQSLYLLGINKKNIIKIQDFTFHQFSKAIWCSPVANIVFQRPNALAGDTQTLANPQQAIFHPEALKITSEYYKVNYKFNAENISNRTLAPELIYISRTTTRKTEQRIILNENYIRKNLERAGFVTIDPSNMSLVEQIHYFSNAKCIVSPSGAALLNMMWAPTGAEIIVLMNESKVNNYWYFSNIASCLGHKLSYVIGKVVETGNWSDINHADYIISFNELLKAILSNSTKINNEFLDEYNERLLAIKYKKIAFLIHEPLLLSHYIDVWNALDKNEFIVVLTDYFYQNLDTDNGATQFINFLQENKINYESFAYIFHNGFKFPYLVTNHVISKFYSKPLSSFIGKKQVRFMYGADVGDGWSLQEWNEMYDYFLCHGENDKKAIESRFKGKTFVMGYPRYDRYFESDLDITSVQKEFEIDSDKKTILWMPTLGGDYSSIPLFADKLKDLVNRYNFIVRPHPISFVQEPDFIQTLERCNYKIDRNAIRDMNALYKIADLVLADNGGSPFSAIFMGKNVIFLEVPEDLGANQNSFHIVNTSVYELKKELPVIQQNNPQQLEELISSKNFYKENSVIIEKLFEKYFNCPRGGGAKRVADILNSLD